MKKILLFLILVSFNSFSQFTESFEAALTAPTGWTIITGGDANSWAGVDLAASTTSQAQNGTKVFSIQYGATAHNDILATPQFVVTAGLTDKISFWGRSRDPLYPETISVKASTTTATTAAFTTTLLATVAPASGAAFYKYTIDLTSLVGQNVFIGFLSTTTDQFIFDIDNVVLGSTLSCTEPTVLPTISNIGATTATLAWSEATPTPSNGYEIYYSTSGVAPTNASIANASVAAGITTYNITGLTQSTKYFLYIRSNCGGTKSVWGHLLVFFSFVDPIPLPYSTGFDDNNQLAGWTQSGNNASQGLGTVAVNAQSPSQYWIFNTAVTPTAANNNWFYSRPFSLSAGEVVTTSFWYRTAIVRNLRLTVGNLNAAANQTTVIYSNATLPIATAYAQITAPTFTAPSTGIYYFAFNDLSASTAAANTLRLDTVSFTSLLGTESFKRNSISIYPNPATNSITISNDANALLNSIEISDINGRVVLTKKIDTTEVQLSVSDLASGVYIVKVTTDKGIALKKFIKE